MKPIRITHALALCLVAYGGGYATHRTIQRYRSRIPEPPVIRQAVAQPDVVWRPAESPAAPPATPSAAASNPRDLETIAALQATIAQLKRELVRNLQIVDVAEQELDSFSIVSRRYNYLMNAQSSRGGLHSLMHIRMDGSLQASTAMLNFLELADDDAEQFREICRDTYQEMLAWEKRAAVVVTESSEELTYQLPPLPEDLLSAFAGSLSALLAKEDVDFVMQSAQRALSNTAQSRVVSLYRKPRKNGSLGFDLSVAYKDEDGKVRRSRRMPIRSAQVPERWQHLFEIDG